MLQKVEEDRLVKVLKVLEIAGVRHPNATLTKEFGIDSGLASKFLNGKIPVPDKAYTDIMQKYGHLIQEDTDDKDKIPSSIDKDDDKSTIQDLAKSILLLSNMGKTLADSNRDVVIMLKESKINYHFEGKFLEEEPSEILKGLDQMAKTLVRKGVYQSHAQAIVYLSKLLVSEEEETMFSDKKKMQDNPNKQT